MRDPSQQLRSSPEHEEEVLATVLARAGLVDEVVRRMKNLARLRGDEVVRTYSGVELRVSPSASVPDVLRDFEGRLAARA